MTLAVPSEGLLVNSDTVVDLDYVMALSFNKGVPYCTIEFSLCYGHVVTWAFDNKKVAKATYDQIVRDLQSLKARKLSGGM